MANHGRMAYRDRTAAGTALSAVLAEAEPRINKPGAIVLGVPRGGVVVAARVADDLGLPLDIALARKLGAPGNPELAVGAVAEGGAVWLNRPLMRRMRLDDAWADDAVRRETAELERRAQTYRTWAAPDLTARVVVVVDDGVATGATLAAVLQALRQRKPAALICAVPVAPPETVPMLGRHCDRVVCPLQPRRFEAVGVWFDDFTQTRDDEVVALLRRGRSDPTREGQGR